MHEFVFTELLPIDHRHSDTPWRLLTAEGISTVEAAGRRFLQVEPEVLTALTREALRDISHLLRPGHLAGGGQAPLPASSLRDRPEP